MDVEDNQIKPYYYVVSSHSHEFSLLLDTLNNSDLLSVDAEWKPCLDNEGKKACFPTVLLLQLGCRLKKTDSNPPIQKKLMVFLVDLTRIDVEQIWGVLKQVFASPDVLILGFGFKQDLIFLESTFRDCGWDSIFEEINSFIDIQELYGRLGFGKGKGLATIYEEVFKITLSKDEQRSDWSNYPLKEEQKEYAARDVTCLLEIVEKLQESRTSCPEDAALIQSRSNFSLENSKSLVLKESDRNPKTSQRRRSKKPLVGSLESGATHVPPWDLSLGGDGSPKFLCDWTFPSLVIRLRCTGIDTVYPSSEEPDLSSEMGGKVMESFRFAPFFCCGNFCFRFFPLQTSRAKESKEKKVHRHFIELIDQASKEKRILLTRNNKLLKLADLLPYQIYRVNSLKKEKQLKEVIQQFNINPKDLVGRCTKCNDMYAEKPLTFEEATEFSIGNQTIPNGLRTEDFWHCIKCERIYWVEDPDSIIESEGLVSLTTEAGFTVSGDTGFEDRESKPNQIEPKQTNPEIPCEDKESEGTNSYLERLVLRDGSANSYLGRWGLRDDDDDNVEFER